MKFEKGQIYESEDTCIFIKMVLGNKVKFIEGFSPAAVHNMQELDAADLENYINKWEYVRAPKEFEEFVNC